MSTSTASPARVSGDALAALVERVAAGDVGGHGLVVEVGDLLRAAGGPHLGPGVEVHLELGVGEHDRADVATLDDAAAVALRPSRAAGRPARRARSALAATELTARVTSGPRISMVASTPSTRTPSSVTSRSTLRARAATGSASAGVDVVAERGEGDGSVHGAGVEVPQTEPFGQQPGHGRLARSGRTVDGDDTHGREARRRALGGRSPARRRVEQVPVAGEGLGHASGIGDRDARRRGDRAARTPSPSDGRRRSR